MKKRFIKISKWYYRSEDYDLPIATGLIFGITGILFGILPILYNLKLKPLDEVAWGFIVFGLILCILSIFLVLFPLKREVYYEELR